MTELVQDNRIKVAKAQVLLFADETPAAGAGEQENDTTRVDEMAPFAELHKPKPMFPRAVQAEESFPRACDCPRSRHDLEGHRR